MNIPKGFLIAFVVGYMALALVLNLTLGPPGLSRDYLEEYRRAHDHYLAITKSDEYKLWHERPHLHPPDETMAQSIAFVEEYEANPDFQAEQARRSKYNISFDLFNVAAVVVLVTFIARKPVVKALDGQIEAVRRRMERARISLKEAEQHIAEIDAKILEVEHERANLHDLTSTRIEMERKRIEEQAEQTLRTLAEETEDRRRHEKHLAEQAMKRELVNRAIGELEAQFRAHREPTIDSALLDQFVGELEAKR